jgi:hypothetical protein
MSSEKLEKALNALNDRIPISSDIVLLIAVTGL